MKCVRKIHFRNEDTCRISTATAQGETRQQEPELGKWLWEHKKDAEVGPRHFKNNDAKDSSLSNHVDGDSINNKEMREKEEVLGKKFNSILRLRSS